MTSQVSGKRSSTKEQMVIFHGYLGYCFSFLFKCVFSTDKPKYTNISEVMQDCDMTSYFLFCSGEISGFKGSNATQKQTAVFMGIFIITVILIL